jgi:ATP-dependent DNA helicase RecG
MTTGHIEKALAAAPAAVGRQILALPEDQWLERKSSRIGARALADTLIGLANADGGLVVIGLHDGKVEGVSSNVQRANEHLQANLDFCVPPVPLKTRFVDCDNVGGEADRLLVFDIEPSEVVHANKRDEVFLRVGDETRRLTFHQRQELEYDKGQSSYESRLVENGSFDIGPRQPDLLDEELMFLYAHSVDAPDARRLMESRGLTANGRLTIAGCLHFAKHPQQFFPQAFVRVLRYHGTDRGSGARQQLIEDRRFEGPLSDQIAGAEGEIQKLQPTRHALLDGGRFGRVPLVPEDAWLEGLVNALIHRSYSAAGDHIRVEIFDDRIEISSPGRFPGLVAIGDPQGMTRFARNPRIARACSDLGYGQELGEGIRRMFEEMRQAGLGDPIYRQTSGSVELTLPAALIDRRLDEQLSDNARLIVATLRKADRISTGEVEELIGASRPTAQRELSDLRDAGLIEWVGKSRQDPRAYWRLATT